MSDLTKDPTNGWTAYTETPMDGLMALLAQVVAQAERDITQAMRAGFVDSTMKVLKMPISDDDDYQPAGAVAFLRSPAAAELCEILVEWSGGAFDLRPARRLAKAIYEGGSASGYDRRGAAAVAGNARSAMRREMSDLPSVWQTARENAVSNEALPLRFVKRLDAEGSVRGKTWREMPRGTAQSREIQAMNWALWKRCLEVNQQKESGIYNERRAA